jgi:hypothetical protein
MTIVRNRVLVSYERQLTTCYECGETGHLYLLCPKRRKTAPTESTEPTSWADIAARGYRSQRDDSGEREEAARQNRSQAEQENGRHTEDRTVIQADKQEPDVPSEPSEEPERKESVRSGVKMKAPKHEEKRSEEDPTEGAVVMARV